MVKPGDAVRYAGEAQEVAGISLAPGTTGVVISTHNVEKDWVAVDWEGVPRPTFHLIEELEPLESP